MTHPNQVKSNLILYFLHESLCVLGEGLNIRDATTTHSDLKTNLLAIDLFSIKTFDDIYHNKTSKKFIFFSSAFTPQSIYVIEKMSHGFNRMGKAHGKGFYNYDTDPPTLWAGLKVFEKRNVNIPEQDILDRLLFATVIGALQTSEEEAAGIDPELKTYIPPEWPLSRQQALSWIDNYGEERFATRLAELAAAYGRRFSDPRKEQPAV